MIKKISTMNLKLKTFLSASFPNKQVNKPILYAKTLYLSIFFSIRWVITLFCKPKNAYTFCDVCHNVKTILALVFYEI